MFNNISWTQYLEVIILMLITYYLFVGLKFYSFELRTLFKGKSGLSRGFTDDHLNTVDNNNKYFHDSRSEVFSSHKVYTPQALETDDTFQKVERLTTQLKEVIASSALNSTVKEEFIFSLYSVLKDYQFLRSSAFVVAINNVITSECDKYGLNHLSDDELMRIWIN